MRHQDRHPEYVEDCRACHFRSVAATYGGRAGYGTRESFHNDVSVAQRERDHVASLKAKGISFDRPDSRLVDKQLKPKVKS